MELKVPPVIVALLVMASMYLASRGWHAGAFDFALRPALAALLLLSGVGVAIAGVITFRRLGTTVNPHTPMKAAQLATDGVYRVTRNPMYLGIALSLAAFAVYLGHALALAGVPLFVLYMNRFQIAPEERALQRLFGTQYRDYTVRVRRWL